VTTDPNDTAPPDTPNGAAEPVLIQTQHDVLTVAELAGLLRVDRKTAYALVKAGEIPGARRIGRTIRIHRGRVLRWLSEGQDRTSRSRRIR
jgi:excisionase family DNA binding protein